MHDVLKKLQEAGDQLDNKEYVLAHINYNAAKLMLDDWRGESNFKRGYYKSCYYNRALCFRGQAKLEYTNESKGDLLIDAIEYFIKSFEYTGKIKKEIEDTLAQLGECWALLARLIIPSVKNKEFSANFTLTEALTALLHALQENWYTGNINLSLFYKTESLLEDLNKWLEQKLAGKKNNYGLAKPCSDFRILFAINRAEKALSNKNFQEAIKFYLNTIAEIIKTEDPDRDKQLGDIYYNLGYSYQSLGQNEQAAEYFHSAKILYSKLKDAAEDSLSEQSLQTEIEDVERELEKTLASKGKTEDREIFVSEMIEPPESCSESEDEVKYQLPNVHTQKIDPLGALRGITSSSLSLSLDEEIEDVLFSTSNNSHSSGQSDVALSDANPAKKSSKNSHERKATKKVTATLSDKETKKHMLEEADDSRKIKKVKHDLGTVREKRVAIKSGQSDQLITIHRRKVANHATAAANGGNSYQGISSNLVANATPETITTQAVTSQIESPVLTSSLKKRWCTEFFASRMVDNPSPEPELPEGTVRPQL